MGYKTALEAAGATVLAYAEFGDYHGTWLADWYADETREMLDFVRSNRLHPVA